MVLPAWLGVADALMSAVREGKKAALRDMYEHWPFFQSVIDLIEMVSRSRSTACYVLLLLSSATIPLCRCLPLYKCMLCSARLLRWIWCLCP